MRLFIDGTTRNAAELYEQLTELHTNYAEISEVICSAYSECSHIVLYWAQNNDVKQCLHFGLSEEEEDAVLTSVNIINDENPDIVMLLTHKSNILELLVEEASENPFVKVVMVKPE